MAPVWPYSSRAATVATWLEAVVAQEKSCAGVWVTLVMVPTVAP